MLFVDQAKITVKGGDGGKGCSAFTQPPYTRSPYPDGGDAGSGGDVILTADLNVATLLDFQFRHEFSAGRGGHGGSNNKTGKRGLDYTIRLPVGTVIMDAGTGAVLRDLKRSNESVIIAHGGAGGRGNANTLEATPGQPGEERLLQLQLKLIADIGLIGFPNAGKSSLLSRISTARPKVAAYPFTTRYPVLGVVSVADRTPIVACDIPGLIEGAHAGKGLGFQFLRHIERTKILIHLVDLSGSDGRDPVQAYQQINQELASYSPLLAEKPQLIAANKMDIPEAKEALARFEREIQQPVWPISCVTGAGVTKLLHGALDALEKLKQEQAEAAS